MGLIDFTKIHARKKKRYFYILRLFRGKGNPIAKANTTKAALPPPYDNTRLRKSISLKVKLVAS